MKKLLILIIVVLASGLYFQDELKQIISLPEVTVKYEDLIVRDGLRYQKFSEVPFTGKITGEIQGSFKNGKREGNFIHYHQNGQLLLKENFKNGKSEGEYLKYHDNGQLWVKSNYKNGKQEGKMVSYHDNGQTLYIGNIKNGKQEGAWVGYNKDGTVIKKDTGTYKDGKKISD